MLTIETPNKTEESEHEYTIICGDCTDPNNYPDKKADLILFDPPFKPMKQPYEQIREDTKNKLEPITVCEGSMYDHFWLNLCSISVDKLKQSGWFIYKADDYTAREVYPITTNVFDYTYSIIWDKCAIGTGRRFRKQHEILEVYTQKNKEQYWSQKSLKSKKFDYNDLDGNKCKIKIDKWHGDSQGVAFPSVLKVEQCNSGAKGEKKEKHNHINQTPEELWIWFLKYCCPKDGLVLDLCAGSFSILKAVKMLNNHIGYNIKYHGIELEPDYCNKANKLIHNKNSLDKWSVK